MFDLTSRRHFVYAMFCGNYPVSKPFYGAKVR
jgi:hypothetical protein